MRGSRDDDVQVDVHIALDQNVGAELERHRVTLSHRRRDRSHKGLVDGARGLPAGTVVRPRRAEKDVVERDVKPDLHVRIDKWIVHYRRGTRKGQSGHSILQKAANLAKWINGIGQHESTKRLGYADLFRQNEVNSFLLHLVKPHAV